MCSRNLKISVVLIFLLVPLIATLPHSHSLSKRSTFFDLECKGIYNKSMFYRLDRICEDCYQLFRETTVHRLCKESCFTTDYFKACVDALHLNDEIEILKNYVKIINGAVPPPGANQPQSQSSTKDCFGDKMFPACIEALQLHEEMEKFFEWRDIIGKKKK